MNTENKTKLPTTLKCMIFSIVLIIIVWIACIQTLSIGCLLNVLIGPACIFIFFICAIACDAYQSNESPCFDVHKVGLSLLIAMFLLFSVLVLDATRAWVVGIDEGFWKSPPKAYIGIRIAIAGLLLSATPFLLELAYKRYRRVYFTQWYDPGDHEPGAPLSWDDIKEVIKLPPKVDSSNSPPPIEENEKNWASDPVAWQSRPRKRISWRAFKDFCGLFAIGIVVWAIARTLWHPDPLTLASRPVDTVGISFAALVALLGVLWQIRAKVRADNRQVWINEIRSILGEIIDGLWRYRGYWIGEDKSRDDRLSDIFRELNSKRLKLEMLLNPSEKEHRALMTLIRKAFGIDIPKVDGLCLHCMGLSKKDGSTRSMDVPSDEAASQDWTSHIIRLANLVLKREWERVKYGR